MSQDIPECSWMSQNLKEYVPIRTYVGGKTLKTDPASLTYGQLLLPNGTCMGHIPDHSGSCVWLPDDPRYVHRTLIHTKRAMILLPHYGRAGY